MKQPFVYIIGILVISLAVFAVLQLDNDSKDVQLSEDIVTGQDKPLFDFNEIEHDFGIIRQSGGIVQYEFPFTYNGERELNITDVPTSCQCTSAEINTNTLNRGDAAVITVLFDPNLHEEPEGKFFKTITLKTEPTVTEAPELKIWAEIDLDLGPEAYKLKFHNN